MKRLFLISFLLFCILLSACSPQPAENAVVEPSATLVPSEVPATATLIATETTAPTATRIMDTPTPSFGICSPLADFSFSDLENAISNPYHPPKLGSDDPHQGVDLAVKLGEIAITGDPVYAVMGGEVAAVVSDRFPYGNAIMIETSLDKLPVGWASEIPIPTPAPTLGPHPSLTCPEIDLVPDWNINQRSLYLLYAHLLEPVNYSLGEKIECGNLLGKIGQSGNALNPHLHLEARVGPAGASFSGLAHYDARVSPEEMYYYCTWRVSDLFQLVDPLEILKFVQ